MSYQRPINPKNVICSELLSRGTLHFVSVSRHTLKPYVHKKNWHLVYNGAPLDAYHFRNSVNKDAPLAFLGQIRDIKGPHLAIETALRSGRRLIIAGNIPDKKKHHTFFRERISPHINGETIQYVGPVTDSQKNELLGQAAAFLMPVLQEEPFGIVMAEALACGTPVIGLNRGAVPEIVQNGVNGFVCDSVDEMVTAVSRIKEIDRHTCRRIMEEKFSDRVIVDEYEKLYTKLIHNGSSQK